MTPKGSGTEVFTTRYWGMETWSDDEIAETIFEDQVASLAAVRACLRQIAAAAGAASARLRDDTNGRGRLVYAGAGTSARLAVQDGVELVPTFGWPEDRLAYLIAGGLGALTRSIEGAEDDRDAARVDVSALVLVPADILIAVSASGTTPYTVTACEAGRNAGALTIGIYNNDQPDGLSLAVVCDHPICAATGPEPIAGSTRMKAGTAQKIILNLLSTLIMVREGRVFEGLMVDMQATNAKLKTRARRMVAQIADVGNAEADRLLEAAGGHVKLAILIQKGLSPEIATAMLDEQGGDLRRVLDNLPRDP
ncbi:MAG: N-acetylmuramic acid 6-phosphate etherase [Alphaproteobacteria bacterium]|nr:N-acetylmuramic acid 6-phosphate etherase [Alphaproteobacteria bacterium]MCZ6764318.1 N-acetylmuramic acid 6-phosphate etherase [Alphaproteobacteria bacterium]